MRRRLIIFVTLAVLAAAATFAAVSGASFTTASSTAVRAATAPLSGDTLRAHAGDDQEATAGAAVKTAPSVKVTDAGGNPVSGVAVTFAIASGGGSVSGASVVTDATGVAAAGGWTLGTTAGVNKLTATATGLSGSVTFTATGTAGAAKTIAINGGGDQSAAAGAAVATSPSVRVTDANGNPVSGVAVTFAASGDGSATGATQTTGASGIATVGGWTLSTVAGANTLTATASGLTPLSIAATGTAGAAATVAINGGNNQSATVNTAVGIAPSVKVEDRYGNAIPGAAVDFAVPSGGGSVTGGTQTTNSSGTATLTSWTLGQTAGVNTLTASVTGATSATFTATGTAGSFSQWVVTSSDYDPVAGSSVTVTAQMADSYGNATTGSSTTVSLSANGVGYSLAGTGGSTTSSYTTTMTTSTTAGQACQVTASSPVYLWIFVIDHITGTSPTITTVAGPAVSLAASGGNGQTATAGTAVGTAPSVEATDQYGNTVPGTTVTFAVASGGGSATGLTATTDGNGIATVGSWKLGTIAGANTLTATSGSLSGSPVTFTATGTAGAATQLAVETAADGSGSAVTAKSVTAGASFSGYAVTRDAYNNFIANAAAAWSLSGSTGGVVAGDLVAAGDGKSAVFTGHLVGTTAVKAVVGGLTDSTGLVTVIKGAAGKVLASAGEGQSVPVNTTVATAPAVLVTDAGGNPISGVSVTFAVASGGGSATGLTATTDGNGIATVGSWKLGTIAGANTLTATSGTLSGSPVTFLATGTAGAATKYSVATPNYYVRAGNTVTISAQLQDTYGNAVATPTAVSVTWSRSTTYGTLQTTSTNTDANGMATVQFTVSTTVGRTNTVIAKSTSATSVTGTSPTITAVGSATTIGAYAGTGQSATAGTAVATAPSVKVTDSGSRPVPGTTVTFAVASGGGSATGLTATTDGNGIATVGSWKLGTIAGANTLTATSGSLSGSPVTFTATGTAGAATQLAVETAADGSGSAVTAKSVTAGASFSGYAVTRDAYNNFIANAAAAWSLSGSTGGVVAGDLVAAGDGKSAVFTGHLVGTTAVKAVVGGLTDSTGLVTVIKGAAGKVLASAGEGQSVPVNTTVATAPAVLVTDAGGNPISGVSVTFAVASGGGSATGLTATTDGNGIATVGSWKLGTIAGANTLTATSGSLSGSPVTFTATGTAGAATQLAVETAADGSGSAVTAKSVTAGASFSGYAVTRDAYNNFIANAAAAWSLSGSTGGVVAGDLVAAGDGRSAVFTGHLVGTTAVKAVVGGLTDSTGLVTVAAGVPATVTVSSSNYNPTGGSIITITAVIVDQWGNPVASGTSVTFAKDTGSSSGGTFSPTSTTTNGSGVATTSFTTGGSGRTYYIKATASTVSGTTPKITTK